MSFGELALVSPHNTRAATIRASTDWYFAVLDKANYQQVYGKHEEKLLNSKIDFLKSVPLFYYWTRDSLRKLTPFLKPLEFDRHMYVIKEGESYNDVS